MQSLPDERLQHGSKVQALCERLTALSYELGTGARLPTVIELRDRLGVSVTTLNTALIELEAKRIIERKHGVGIFVSRHLHQKTIGLVCSPEFFRAGTSPFWHELIEGVRRRAVSRNTMFRFYLAIDPNGSAPVHDDLLQDVEAERLNGVIYVGQDKPAVNWLLSHNVPVVSFAGWSQWMVRIDFEGFVRRAVETLVSRGLHNLGLVCPGEPGLALEASDIWEHSPSRVFREVMQQHGLPINEAHIWDGAAQLLAGGTLPGTHEEQGYLAAQQLFAPEKPRPEGLIISDDMQARGLLPAMREMGVRAGTDVQIVTHLNRGSEVLRGWENKVSTIEFDPTEVVDSLFESLEALMRGEAAASMKIIAPVP